MKNLFVLLLAAFSALSPIFAQAPQFKSGDNYTVFGLGIGIPIGQFGATKNLDTDGFAQSGIAINLDDSYFLTENFAILLSGYITFNSHNTSALSSAFSSAGLPNVNVSTRNNFFGLCATLGPMLVLPIGNQFNFKLRSGAGISYWETPEYEVSVQGVTLRITRASSWVFAFLLGAGVGYKISDGWELQLLGDFQSARPRFRFRDPSGGISESNLTTSLIAVSLGVAFEF
ncbi:MAG: hypothetical protein RMI34_00350 [Chloroherpetonaceae bacterium]|nr:hypothetical protein [Chloroherpetonaceae bacterium]MDW8018510.1 hypothetical protein [Chloroherpetonaceae bacterium]MDW8465380.1 hypothetical protein [Chloroherpetonaceae bacterium]